MRGECTVELMVYIAFRTGPGVPFRLFSCVFYNVLHPHIYKNHERGHVQIIVNLMQATRKMGQQVMSGIELDFSFSQEVIK